MLCFIVLVTVPTPQHCLSLFVITMPDGGRVKHISVQSSVIGFKMKKRFLLPEILLLLNPIIFNPQGIN